MANESIANSSPLTNQTVSGKTVSDQQILDNQTTDNATPTNTQSISETVSALANTLTEHHLSRITYKGTTQNGTTVDIVLESAIPTYQSINSTQIPQMQLQMPSQTSLQLPNYNIPVNNPTATASQPADTASIASGTIVKAPMIGILYVAADPKSPPFIQIGDTVKADQTLFIVEIMKTMNPVKSPCAGVIKEIFVQNGKPVEYDQPLVRIE